MWSVSMKWGLGLKHSSRDSNYHDRITIQAIPTTITTNICVSTFTSNLTLKKIRKRQFGPRMVIFGQGTGSDTSELYKHWESLMHQNSYSLFKFSELYFSSDNIKTIKHVLTLLLIFIFISLSFPTPKSRLFLRLPQSHTHQPP